MDKMIISSPAFRHNQYIPSEYTCDGRDNNPPLTFENVPENAQSLAMIVDDPDAPGGMWVHWVVWDMSLGTKEVQENSTPSGARKGINDFKTHEYGGPCPPSGTHRYFFKLYALDKKLDLAPETTKSALEKAMKGHVIAQAELVGLYKRNKK